MTTPTEETRVQKALVVLGILVLAFNLRPAAVSIGPVLDETSSGLGLNPTQTGLLTTLPVLCFATIGALAPRVSSTLGLHRTTFLALLLLSSGLVLRARVDTPLGFLALAGMAVANVLLPSLVKLHFPGRVGLLTALYSTALAIGLTSASVLTVPLSGTSPDGSLDWRRGLTLWAFTALVAALPWVALLRHDNRPAATGATFGAGAVARTRIGWLMAAFFGLQALQAYSIFGWLAQVFRDAGYDAHDAGLLLGATTGISIPVSFVIPALTARAHDPRVLLTAVMACYPIGYLGLILAPAAGAWVWAVALGLGTCTFPFILTLIGMRSRTPGGTAALSGFTQSVGYLIAVLGPFGVGALYGASDGWALPLSVLLALCVPQYLVGLAAAGPAYVEDQLAARTPTRVAE